MSFVDRLVAHWKMERVSPDVQATAKAIDEFQSRFNLTLPADVRAFYERFNGLLDMDADLNKFWPIEELDTVPNKVEPYASIPDFSGISARLPDAANYFAFADHSIWVFVYAFRLTGDLAESGPVVWIADGNTHDTIAESFAGFWQAYLDNPDRIMVP